MAFFEPIGACMLALACLTPAPPAESTFLLTSHETSGRVGIVSLSCQPTGGSHPKSDSACENLSKVDGNFDRLRGEPRACTLEYAPVDVSAVGKWRGEPVTYRTSYPNRCVADTESAGVFTF
ncbi:SSI family serine proteinase inhibitor [Amycolatopsis sp. NPDC051071]|uniref:SSI family serine proteinase inhibitor n=1 Tax=Amycolatopsis sp. NPDC051071 TaxID=3154637 RepID=UPI00342926EC